MPVYTMAKAGIRSMQYLELISSNQCHKYSSIVASSGFYWE
jgi:hypothetical protein